MIIDRLIDARGLDICANNLDTMKYTWKLYQIS